MNILISQAILALFNLINSRIDAYRIMKNKTIAHGINFGAYCVVTGLIIWLFHYEPWQGIVFAVSAFFQRQLSFDIPLNLRRGKAWNYVSLDKPPKALMDRIEIRLFGYNGTAPVVVYGLLWCGLFTLQFFL